MKKRVLALALAGIITASSAATVCGAEPPKGIVFTDESGYHASTYTGYIGAKAGDTAQGLLSALVNSNGITVTRGTDSLSDDKKLATGDVLSTATGTVFTVIVMGDVNADSSVNLIDASTMMKKTAKWECTLNETAADVDGNGTVTLADVSTVLKISAGWDIDTVMKPVDPAKKESVGGNNAVPVYTGDANTPLNLIKGDLGIRFTIEEGEVLKSLTGIYPSWANAIGELTLGIYKWDTDYATTISAMPIYEEKMIDRVDGYEGTFDVTDSIGNGLGAGEYLWLLSEGVDNTPEPHGIGVWSGGAPAEYTGITLYFNGEVQSYGVRAWINTAKVK